MTETTQRETNATIRWGIRVQRHYYAGTMGAHEYSWLCDHHEQPITYDSRSDALRAIEHLGRHGRYDLSHGGEYARPTYRAKVIATEGTRVCSVRQCRTVGRYAVFTGAVYEARRRRKDDLLTWRLVEDYGRSATAKSKPSAKLIADLMDEARHPWVDSGSVRHGMRAE